MCIKKEKAESPTPTNPTAGDTRKSSGVTVKKPLPASFKHDPSLPLAAKSSRLSHSGSPVTLPSRGAKKSSPLVKQFLPVEGRGRKTMNSLSVAEPIFGNGLPPPNACIKVPDPPSRSPSPPANVVFQGRGNRYTQEDREYFIKFISWRLKQNSSLSRHELCEMLAEKVVDFFLDTFCADISDRLLIILAYLGLLSGPITMMFLIKFLLLLGVKYKKKRNCIETKKFLRRDDRTTKK